LDGNIGASLDIEEHRMRATRDTKEEVGTRGREIYEQQIRAKVEPEHNGKYLVINVETGEYEIDADDVAVMKRAAAKRAPETLYGMRIGHRSMGRMGFRSSGSRCEASGAG
jgi:hypothetical protein